MQNQKVSDKLYVVFSATPYRVGKMIRMVTGSVYNHMSISLDKSLESMVSFSRYYENTPFYAGLVEESLKRFQCQKTDSTMLICEVPLNKMQQEYLQRKLDRLIAEQDTYIYNYLSAACVPFHHRVYVDKSYTCIEFVCTLLDELGIYHTDERCPSFDRAVAALRKYKIYEGPSEGYHVARSWGGDAFPNRQPGRVYFKGATGLLSVLIKRRISERKRA